MGRSRKRAIRLIDRLASWLHGCDIMRAAWILVAACGACGGEHVAAARLPTALFPALETAGVSYPTLVPDRRPEPAPVDPYGPGPVMHAVVDGDHIPVDIELGNPGAVTKLAVDVKASYAFPDRPHHRVVVDNNDVQHVTVEVGPGAKVTPAEVLDALRSNPRIDADSAAIKRASREAVGHEHGDRARVAALVTWTYEHMTYVSAEDTIASTVLEKARGDCSEFSLLFVALARAAGIPARRVVGLAATEVMSSPAFGFHAWAEVALDGHWVQVDPTWNEVVTDATHIVLMEGEGELWALALPDLQVAVVEVERDPKRQARADARMLTRELPSYMKLR